MGWEDAVITGGLGLLGNVFSAKSASRGVQDQNAANAAEAQRNRDFQLYMSNTAHQREVADLRAAGLNPILSANAGASSMPGSLPTMQNTKEQSSAIMAGTAKLISDTILNRAMAKTEQKKQENLDADTKYQKKGQVSVNSPWGGFSIPIGSVSAGLANVGASVSKGVSSAKSFLTKATTSKKQSGFGNSLLGIFG